MWLDLPKLSETGITIFIGFLQFTFGYGGTPALPSYLVLLGGKVELPCDLNVTFTEDEVSLVLWHRGESGNPVYTVDARDMPLPAAKHFPGADMATRAYFNSTVSPAVLRLEGVKKEEEGIYRCRVEYRRARTETTDLFLKVIVPPREAIIMDEFGQHLHGVIGPYNEGFPLSLICEGEGGEPSPSVSWWKGSDLLEDTFSITPQGIARNELLLPSLQRSDLMTKLTCQVTNSNLTAPVTSSVILDMNLRPTDVRITSYYSPMSVGREAEVVCVSRGARPPAQISWWMDGEQLTKVTESIAKDDNLTVSTVTLTPSVDDDGRNLSCRADNPQLPESLLEDMWILNVYYLPHVSVRLSSNLPVPEYSEVTLTCDIQANPSVTDIEWLQDGRSLGPPLHKEQQRNQTLVIPSVGPSHKGFYQCAATNIEGRAASKPILLRVHYSPKCQSVRSSVYGVGRTESVSVACEVDADPGDVTFNWVLNNSARAYPLPSSHFTSNGTKSVATVSPRSVQDYGVLHCWASNAMGKQREPCSFRIIPAGPPEEPKNCIVLNRTQECISLECEGGEDGGLQQLFQLEVFSTDSDKFLLNVSAHKSPSFTVCSLPTKESLLFIVYATNSKGRSKQVAVHTSTLAPQESENGMDGSGMLSVILGIIIGALSALALLAIIVYIVIKIQSKRTTKARAYRPDIDKCDAHLMKECKDPCVAGSQGPDIIPEKNFFQVERQEPTIKTIETEDVTNSTTPKTDPSSRKYREYQTVTYTEEPEFLSTPRKLRMLQEIEGEVEESGITVETPLISSLPLQVQQWTDHRKDGLRLSTPV